MEEGVSEPRTFSERADEVRLRGRPRKVARLNRKTIMASAGAGAALLFAAASIALDPPKLKDEAPAVIYNVGPRPPAEALDALPKSYADLKGETPPQLGPPLPGDLGAAFLAAERDQGAGLDDVYAVAPDDFRAAPEEDAMRAERLRMAKLGEESLASPVSFVLRGANAPPVSREGGNEAGRPPASELAALHFANAPANGARGDDDPNLQNSKRAFADAGDRRTLNPHALTKPVSPYLLIAGAIIPASLVTGLNSDLPGTIIAQVTAPVYDTATGAHLLIPQGARLIGRYDARVSFGQDRALIVWDRLIMPDGASILLDALPGADAEGYAGLSDRVDHHTLRLLFAGGLATLLGVGAELGDDDGDLIDALRDGGEESLARVTQRIVDRNLDIQPTLRVRPGFPLRVIVTRDLVLEPRGFGR